LRRRARAAGQPQVEHIAVGRTTGLQDDPGPGLAGIEDPAGEPPHQVAGRAGQDDESVPIGGGPHDPVEPARDGVVEQHLGVVDHDGQTAVGRFHGGGQLARQRVGVGEQGHADDGRTAEERAQR
jgi:hypothetical protein